MFRKERTIETGKSFSESMLWSKQKSFYSHKGEKAWTHGDIPFYITSNVYFAYQHASLIFNLILDFLRLDTKSIDNVFYIIEFGAGHGRFSFYVIKELCNLISKHNLEGLKFSYVITDFVEKNLEFCSKHPAFDYYKRMGFVNFALFDLVSGSKEIKLLQNEVVLTKSSVYNPIIAIANYILDSIPQDAFCFKNKVLYELLPHITYNLDSTYTGSNDPTYNNANDLNIFNDFDINNINIKFIEKETKLEHYSNALLNDILHDHYSFLENGCFTFPITAFSAIDFIASLSNKLILISSDKAYTKIENIVNTPHPTLTKHNQAFSFMVNYYAIGRYFERQNGIYSFQTTETGTLKTCIFGLGLDFSNLHFGLQVYSCSMANSFACSYTAIYVFLSKNLNSLDLTSAIAYLEIFMWDPTLYCLLSNQICDAIHKNKLSINSPEIASLFIGLDKLLNNFYHMPNCADLFFEAGCLYFALGLYDKALEMYQISLDIFGEQYCSIYNMALCFYYSKNTEKAVQFFKIALCLYPDSEDAKKWLKKLS